MSVKWVVPVYEMLVFELMLGLAVGCSIVNLLLMLEVSRRLKDLIEALQEAEG